MEQVPKFVKEEVQNELPVGIKPQLYHSADDHETVNLRVPKEHILEQFPNSTTSNSKFYVKLAIALIVWIILVFIYMNF